MNNFEEKGFEVIHDFLQHDVVSKILYDLNSVELGHCQGGLRNIESQFASVEALVNSDYLKNQAASYLIGIPNFVRAIYFNKSANNNWLVPWHQDKTIAVSERLDIKGWRSWSIKNGKPHVQPPSSVLNDMVTFRINLDDVTKDNGCLKVIPGSHKRGILSQNAITDMVAVSEITHCFAPKASALVMKPLIIHSSNKAKIPDNRRVLHIEYSSFQLPGGLKWALAV